MAAHRIKRVTFELAAPDVALARTWSDRCSALFAARVTPLLDHALGQRSGQDRIDRIDRIELDLGTLDPGDDDELLRRLADALDAALARSIRPGPDDRTAAPLEILALFARAGNLPWFADRNPDCVTLALTTAAEVAPLLLLDLLHTLADDPPALARLARHCPSPLLAVLLGRCFPDQATHVTAVQQTLEAAAHADPIARATIHRAVLTAIASRGPALRTLAADLSPTIPTIPTTRPDPTIPGTTTIHGSTRPPFAAAARRKNPQGDESEPLDDAGAALPYTSTTIEDRAPHIAPTTPRRKAPRTPLDPRRRRRPVLASRTWRRTLTADPPSRPPDEAIRLESAFREHSPPPREPSSPHRPFSAHARPHSPRPSPPPIDRHRALRQRMLAEQGELHLEDGGLVLLWPFLDRFLQRVGLVDRGVFQGEDARLQAVALLATLATGDPDPPEFALPLAKLLCGHPLADPVQRDEPIPPAHLAEAEVLLTAVIDHVPPLNAMASATFRAAFLVRPAVLHTRDGAWTLQVERHPHDALLDRFPWAWSWVKLPWMPDPLRVEW